ncbi:MAG: PAS-domain containing protein [Rhodocyclaceae bacterium]
MPEQAERSVRHYLKPLTGAGLVLAAGLALSLLLWHETDHHFTHSTETLLDHQAGIVESNLKQRLNEFESILLGMQGLYVSSEGVSRVEFHRYLDNLRLQGRTGGIRALHFTRRVAQADKAAFVAAVRGDRSLDPRGYPDFAIHPEGQRAEYFVIEFIEPFAENRPAFGLDANTQAANRASFPDARDQARTYLTPPFQLVQTGPGQLGLVLRAPVYRNGLMAGSVAERRAGLEGFVGITLEADGLLAGIMDAPALAGLRAVLRDLGPTGAEAGAEAAAVTITESGSDIAPLLATKRTIEAAGRRWELGLSAGESWLAAQPGRNQALAFLAAGGAISLLLAALYIALAGARERAWRMVEERTRELKRSEERFRTATEVSSEWYWEQDRDYRFVSFVGTAARPAGREAFLGKTRWEAAPDMLSAGQWAAHRADIEARRPFALTYPVPQAGASPRWVETKGQPRFDERGEFIGYHGTARDITEQIDSEARLREQAGLLRTILEHMNQGISVVDADLNLVGCNRRFLDLLGFPEDLDREGTPFEAYVRFNAERGEYGPGDIDRLVRERVELARGFLPHRFKRTRPDGTVIEVLGTPLPGGGMVTTYTDITEQEKTQEAVRRERDFRQHIIESIPGVFYLIDPDGRFLLWNRNFERVAGYSAEAMASAHPLDFFEGADKQRIAERIGKVFTEGSATANALFRTHDGTLRPYFFTGVRVALEDGRPGLVGVGTDMTERQQIEDALARQTAVLQATLEAMDQGISVVDRDLRMTALNRKFCELLEFPEEMARSGTSFADFARFNAERGEYGPCDVENKVREMVERARHVEPHCFRRRRPNGRVIEVRGNPLPGGGFVTTYTDVTEQEHVAAQIRQERDFRQRLIESIPGIFFLFDASGRFLMWNKNLETVLDMSADDIAAGHTLMLYDETEREHMRQVTKLVLEAGASSTEATLLTRRGDRIPYFISGLRIDVDGRPSVIGLGLDITERKLAEQVIRDLNDTLEQRVQERTADLEASNRELESFSYSVSHDLRAPLRALHGFSHLLGEEYAHRLDENGLHYLQRIQAASERMGKLIDDLIEMARISRQDLTRVPVDLGALAREIRQGIEEQQPGRRVDWHIGEGLVARADPVLAKALLDNLLRNAWKFTAERADARIAFSAREENGETVFAIGDNGAGFEMAYADKLFKPFQRLHDAKRFEGTGIGLAIVHRIVHRHGGRIWAESQPGQGAVFHFTLP